MSALELKDANLARIAGRVQVPAYDRRALAAGLVHIGVGGFFRAHQAVYLDDLAHRRRDGAWGYCGVGLLANDRHMRDALVPQDGLFTVVERSAQDEGRGAASDAFDPKRADDEVRSLDGRRRRALAERGSQRAQQHLARPREIPAEHDGRWIDQVEQRSDTGDMRPAGTRRL